MLTLAAMHLLNNSADPFFTSLQAGAYAKVRPSGRPCDAVFPEACVSDLSQGAKIAIGVIVALVGLSIVGLGAYYVYLVSFAPKMIYF